MPLRLTSYKSATLVALDIEQWDKRMGYAKDNVPNENDFRIAIEAALRFNGVATAINQEYDVRLKDIEAWASGDDTATGIQRLRIFRQLPTLLRSNLTLK